MTAMGSISARQVSYPFKKIIIVKNLACESAGGGEREGEKERSHSSNSIMCAFTLQCK